VTELLLAFALGNMLLAMPLALLAWTIGRWRRYPALAHFAWVLVMARLVMPPIAALPWLSVSIPLPRPMAASMDSLTERRVPRGGGQVVGRIGVPRAGPCMHHGRRRIDRA
jgi:hypothetical protein